ncbi:MAG TPA: hypothetical protein V6C81_03835 [Planktothrix sp.]|jgi:hypothetical protein
MIKFRAGETLTFALTSTAVVAGIMMANTIVSTPATGQSTNPYHDSNPYHSTNPYHGGGGSGGTTTLPLSATAFKCNTHGYDVKSQWVTNGTLGIYDFYGDEVPNSQYACTTAGFRVNLLNSTTTFNSFTYELNNASNCNNNIGPDLFINFNLSGGGTGTNRIVCSYPNGANQFYVGQDSSTGYAIYSIPLSAAETVFPFPGDTAYEAGDTLNAVSLVFLPGMSTQGTVKVIKPTLNGATIIPAFGLTAGCQDYVQTELQIDNQPTCGQP